LLKASNIVSLARETVAPVIEQAGYKLLEVNYLQSRGWVLRLVIDTANDMGVSIDDCVHVSGLVSEKLDREDLPIGRYRLEVSSPGMDRKLYGPEDYKNYSGRKVKIRLAKSIDSRKNFSGKLVGFKGGELKIETGGESFSFPIDDVKEIRLVPEWDHRLERTSGRKSRRKEKRS